MTAEHTPAAAGAMAGLPASGDRRRHPRCPVGGRAVAFYGGCTCAVHDVSVTGLAIQLHGPRSGAAGGRRDRSLLADSALYLPRMPIRLVAEARIAPLPLHVQQAWVCPAGGIAVRLPLPSNSGTDSTSSSPLPAAPPAPDRLPGREVSPRSAAFPEPSHGDHHAPDPCPPFPRSPSPVRPWPPGNGPSRPVTARRSASPSTTTIWP